MMRTAKEIANLLAEQAESVTRYLLPQGKKSGTEFKVGNIQGESGDSLSICITGTKMGLWSDFATGEGGDLLDLWAQTRGITIADAMKEASRYLGITTPIFAPIRSQIAFKRPDKKLYSTRLTKSVEQYLTRERHLLPKTIEAFKVASQGNQVMFPYWRDNELIFVKYLNLNRENGKKQITVEKDCEPCLFGWHLVPITARTITLCEGEIDAMTLYQYGFSTLSVPFGGGAGNKHKWLEYEFERLAQFDVIYLCLDNDEEGQIATQVLAERLGFHRCKSVILPYKDANACLQARLTKAEIQACFDNAKNFDPTELKRASSYAEAVVELMHPSHKDSIGYSLPWEKTHGFINLRPGELSVWTGINGHGKSQLLGHALLHWINAGARVCIASLELKPARLLARLTKQAGAVANPASDYIRAIHTWYGDNLWLFDLVGTAKVKRLLEVFLYARQRYGVDMFIIDSFMKLDISEDDYRAQKAFIEQLCDFKNEHHCHIHVVVHPRKSADESQPPSKLDNKGTGAITDLADNCFCVWRRKAKEEASIIQASGHALDAKQQALLGASDSVLICDKQRNGDWEGKIGLWFDRKSYQYLNHSTAIPFRYVNYSIHNR